MNRGDIRIFGPDLPIAAAFRLSTKSCPAYFVSTRWMVQPSIS
jgi:hypothetical protein